MTQSEKGAADGNGDTLEGEISFGDDASPNATNDAADQLRDLANLGDLIEIAADWRDDLSRVIRRRAAIAELLDESIADDPALTDEVELFKRFCRAVGWGCHRP